VGEYSVKSRALGNRGKLSCCLLSADLGSTSMLCSAMLAGRSPCLDMEALQCRCYRPAALAGVQIAP
jgi:hypothetical protein